MLERTLGALVAAGLSSTMVELARTTMRQQLLALDAGEGHATVEGTVVDNVVRGPWKQ